MGGGFVFDSYGGAINRVPAGATAFVHRDALGRHPVQLLGSAGATRRSSTAGTPGWPAHSSDRPPTHGAYQNYIDPTLAGLAAGLLRVEPAPAEAVNAAVDPDDLFHFAQSIPR